MNDRMSLQDNINDMLSTCLGNKESIIKAITKASKVLDACDEAMSKEDKIDKFKYYLAVKNATSEFIEELMKLAGEYGGIKESALSIKKAWDGYVFKDENSYFERYTKESKKRQTAENRLSALIEIYGADEIKKQLIEYQKYHDIKL